MNVVALLALVAAGLVGPGGAGIAHAGPERAGAPAVTDSGAVGVLAAAPAAVTAVPRPAVALPSALDARPRYQAQVSCDPTDKPGASAVGALLASTYGVGTYGLSRRCDGATSEHYDGRAVDWMLDARDPARRAVGDAAVAWLSRDGGAAARRLGVQYVIWNTKVWRAYAPERGWMPYTGANPHTDHVHISLTWDGAFKRTSWWTGRAVTVPDLGPCRVHPGQPAPVYAGRRTGPCPPTTPAPATTYRVYLPGQSGADVAVAQRLLRVSATARLDAATRSALLAYQGRRGLPRTGALDAATWVSLVPSSAPKSTAPRTTAPKSTAPTSAPPSSRVTTPTAVGLRLPAVRVSAFAAAKRTPLRPGATGPTVRLVQRTLRVPVTGRLDARTSAAVAALQARWRLPVTGAVDGRTWNRIDLVAHPWLGFRDRLAAGSTGSAVAALQRALAVPADGRFGPLTQARVRLVQRTYGRPATGVVDEPTWRAVAAWAARRG